MIYFTSDHHFFHKNIILYCDRPFENVETMNRELIARHNAVVKPEDEFWHIGDFSLGEKYVPVILPQLNGTPKLVMGNHDACHPCNKKHEAKKRYYQYGFKEIHLETQLDGFLINHLPYTGDSKHEARYPQYRPINKGQWLIHGHVHNSWKIKDKMINVGVDVWDYYPVSFDEIKNIII